MRTFKKGVGTCGLILFIMCLAALNEKFGSTAWLLGLGCGAGAVISTISNLLD